MRRSRFWRVATSMLVVALALVATVTLKLYGEARSANAAAMQWKTEALGWQSAAQRTARHDAVVRTQNRALVRRYNHLISATDARQQRLVKAVQRAQEATTAKEAAAAAASAQATANQPVATASGASTAGAQAAPAVTPTPQQPPASAAS